MNEEIEGKFGMGELGSSLSRIMSGRTNVLPNSPSERAGLKAGDAKIMLQMVKELPERKFRMTK